MKKIYFKKIFSFTIGLLLLSIVSFSQATYYWVGGSGGEWNSASSWNTNLNGSGSDRTPANTGDVLIFDGSNIGGTIPLTGTVTPAITGSFTIGSLYIQNAANVILNRNGGGTSSCIIMGDGNPTHDFTISANSSLTITTLAGSGLNLIVSDPGNSSATASISGALSILDNGSGTARLTAVNPMSVFFEAGSVCNSNLTQASSYPFGSSSNSPAAAVNGVVFQSGSVCKFLGGNSVQANTSGFFPIKWNKGSTLEMYAVQPSGLFGSKYLANVKVKTGVTITLTDNTFGLDTLTIENGAAFNYRTTGTLPIKGDIINNGIFGAAAGFTSSNLVLIGTVPQRVTGSGIFNNFGTLSIGTDAGVTLYTNIAISGSSTSSVTGKLNTQTHTVSGTGNFQFRTAATANSMATLTEGNNTVTLANYAAGNVAIGAKVTGNGIAPDTYIISTNSGASSFNMSNPATASYAGNTANITIENFAPTFETANAGGTDGTIINSGSRTFSPGTNYIFNGATVTPFSAATNNAAGNVTINANVSTNKTNQTVNGTLSLGSGLLTIRSTDTVRITSGNAILGAPFSNAKYIVSQVSGANAGVLRADGISGAMLFPVGSVTNYMPVTLTPLSSSDFAASVFEGITADGTPAGTPLSASQKARVVNGVWTINRINGTGNAEVTLSWPNSLEGSEFMNFPNSSIGVGRYNGGAWEQVIGSGDNSTNLAMATYSEFSPFSVGELGYILPIGFKDVSATVKPQGVEIAWEMLDDENGIRYAVERSSDGIVFDEIGAIQGKTLKMYSLLDANNLLAKSYYRIKLNKIDGQMLYSNIIMVNKAKSIEVIVYPNPASKTLIIAGLNEQANLRIFNAAGQQLLQKRSTANSISVDISNLRSGIYFIEIMGKTVIRRSFIKE